MHHFITLTLLLLLLTLGACQNSIAPELVVPATVAAPTAVADTPRPVDVTVLYTNDEHGWMEGLTPGAGAAQLMALWQADEGLGPGSNTLVLSGGDMWTGPAISSWFDGASMAEVMNAMGYTAAAVGNHEFDFGLATLRERADQSRFPLLSANIRSKSSGEPPAQWGIAPYTLVDVDGVTVGIIGLTTTLTPVTTNPTYVAEFDFIDYETALREIVPEVREAGADLLLVPAHICQQEQRALAQAVDDLGIHLIGGGHCNERVAEEVAGTVLLQAGTGLEAYGRVTFTVDATTGTVVGRDIAIRTNDGASPAPEIAAIVDTWRAATEAELSLDVGYSAGGLRQRGQAMQDWVAGSWLAQIPTADIAITNLGGFRADLPPGPVTLGTIITVLPFDNVIVDLELTGAELIQVLGFAAGDAAIAGARQAGSRWLLTATGAEIDPAATYSVLVNNFMYAGGDDYTMLAQFDPNAYDTAIDWRQPVIDWTIDQSTSADYPLETAIDSLK